MSERLFLRLDGDPLYAPETSVPAGTMREYPVGAALRPFVAAISAYREQFGTDDELVERVLPDGAVRLIFNFGDSPQADRHGASPADGTRRQSADVARVVGPSTAPAVLRLAGRIDGISVTLRPGAAPALLGVPAGELAERAVALDTLWRRDAGALVEQLAAARDDAARANVLQRVLLRRLGVASPRPVRDSAPDLRAASPAAHAAQLIATSRGQRSLRDIADAIGVGERRLQQLFHAHVGLSPRAWSRLARLHACLRALRAEASPRWAHVAADGGFYDQSHLVNEFRALCGLTPGMFLERART